MARMRPELTERQLDELPSQAEARFYRACRDQLDDRIMVLHSVRFVSRNGCGIAHDGEADFIILDPASGFAVIEVKGGGITFDPVSGKWKSVDRKGTYNSIKNPIQQAMIQKKTLLDLLRSHPSWSRMGNPMVLAAHGVFFPDVRDVGPFVSPECTRDMVGGNSDLQYLNRWLSALLRMWGSGDRRLSPLGAEGIAIAEEVFCRQIEVRPLVSVLLRDEEVRRIKLTEQQSRILRTLGARHRAAICGGAGTGKTVLALQRARELASSGKRTLLLCFNRPLADHLKFAAGSSELLRPMTFHQLCEWLISEAASITKRDLKEEARQAYPRDDYWNIQLPYALGLATNLISQRFDAIIVDEGQDFRPEFWLPLELLLADIENSTLMVFFDQNQAVYHPLSGCPIDESPYVLTVNCRNTRYIHEAAYRYFRGEPTDPSEIEGAPISLLCSSSPPSQAAMLHAAIAELIDKERVSPNEIAVLIADNLRRLTTNSLRQSHYPVQPSGPPSKFASPTLSYWILLQDSKD